MTINRIESLVFGVTDIPECVRFYTDAGLVITTSGADRAELRTPELQTVVLRPIDDPSLPKAAEEGPTLRELVWGVSDKAHLDKIADELSRDRPVTADADGVVHSRDNTGFGIGFMLTREVTAPEKPLRTYNSLRQVNRWNDPVTAPDQPHPLRIVHVALNIPKAGHQEAIDFYLNRLGFKATDDVKDTGTFMQCSGDVEHHNFFLCHRPDKAGFNHCAFEVRDFDELIQTGNHMIARGWKESRVLGRHLLGSNLYRFFHSPAGGRLEFETDMDRLDKSFKTRVWDKNPGHHIWTMKSSGQPETVG